jgi:hypothetical protein
MAKVLAWASFGLSVIEVLNKPTNKNLLAVAGTSLSLLAVYK